MPETWGNRSLCRVSPWLRRVTIMAYRTILQTLMGDQHGSQFLREWPQTHVVAHAPVTRFDAISRVATLSAPELIAHEAVHRTVWLRDRNGTQISQHVAPAQLAIELFESGTPVALKRLQHTGLFSWTWGSRLLHELNVPIDRSRLSVTAVLTPRSTEVTPRYDEYGFFSLQFRGERHWRLAPTPSVLYPTRGWAPVTGQPMPLACRRAGETVPALSVPEITRPGDVLFVPAGQWYESRTDAASLSLVVVPRPVRVGELVLDSLEQILQSDVAWRGPVFDIAGTGERDTSAVHFETLMSWLCERLDEPSSD